MSRAEVWAAGCPLSTVCYYTDLGWTKKWGYGDWEARFRTHARPRWRTPYLRKGNEIVIRYGAGRRFLGDVESWNRETGEVYVRGRIRAGEGYLVRGNFDVTTAVNALIAGDPPLNWKIDTDSIPVGPTYAADHDPVYLLDLLEADAKGRPGQGAYMIGPDGRLRYVERPTTPTWQVWPEAVDLGEAGGPDRATSVSIKFINSVAPIWAPGGVFMTGDYVIYSGDFWQAKIDLPTSTPGENDTEWVNAGSIEAATDWVSAADTTVVPYKEVEFDATSYGPMTEAAAQTMADRALATLLEPVYMNDVPADPRLVATWTGGAINPLTVNETLGRVWGTSHPRLGHPWVDLLAGEVQVTNADTATPKTVIRGFQKPLGGLLDFVRANAPTVSRELQAS